MCRYVIVVEHDLSVLDYLSDFICCLYGVPGVYGVVTMPIGVREGINIFLDGYIPAENLRFRETSLVFKVAESADQVGRCHDTMCKLTNVPKMTHLNLRGWKQYDYFELSLLVFCFPHVGGD